MDIIEKLSRGGITHKEVVFNFYMPIGKISVNSITYKNFVKNGNKRTVETEYGKVEIRNRILTEYHRKIILAIASLGTSSLMSDGTVITYFNEIDILRELEMGEKNHAALKEQIKYIADAQYYFYIGSFSRKVSILQEHAIEDTKKRKAQAVVFSKEYVNMHRSDFTASNKNLFLKISSIPFSTIPTIIYSIIFKNRSDNQITYSLSGILKEIGFPLESPSAVKKIRHSMKLYAETLKKDYNIYYNNTTKTLEYKKIEELEFIEELECSIEDLNSYVGKIFILDNKEYEILSIKNTKDDNIEWMIETKTKSIKLNYFLDDLLFLLSRTTKNKKTISLSGLFSEEE